MPTIDELAELYQAIDEEFDAAAANLLDGDGRPLLRDDLHAAKLAELQAHRDEARRMADDALQGATVAIRDAIGELPTQPYGHLTTEDLTRLDALRKTLRADAPADGDEPAIEQYLSDALSSQDPVYRMAAAAAARDWGHNRNLPMTIAAQWQMLQDTANGDRINPEVRTERSTLQAKRNALTHAARFAGDGMAARNVAEMLRDYAELTS